jgi:5-(carboxyamino)imidazole ribonucleotide synthase
VIIPGQTIGVLGGGPVGRMLTHAAQTLGYRVHVFEPGGPSPAGVAANREFTASYEDVAALREFARQADVITCAFENIPADPLHAIAPLVPLFPRVEALHVCQNRQREKAWLRANGFPQVRYAEALDGDIVAVIGQVGRPCVVKTADFDHDGRGQMKIVSDADLEKAEAIFRGRRCILERWVDFSCELCVIVARSVAGEVKAFPVSENIHARQVLDVSIVPARISGAIAREAVQLTIAMAEKLGVVGLLAAELFVMPAGDVLVNELAPRPHNGGHWSMDTCETSQFEQLVRAVCGWPLGSVEVREPTVLVNLLGDLWSSPRGPSTADPVCQPDWSPLLEAPRAKLHLYGEGPARSGRRMGHFTVWDQEVATALARAKELKETLRHGRDRNA